MRWLARLVLCPCLILLGLIPVAVLAKAEPRLALIIANGAYKDGLPRLANPVNDGKLIADTLQKLGFAVSLVSDVDQNGMKRAISQFGDALEKAGPTSIALFYYAGGGAQVDGQQYLVPVRTAIVKEADFSLKTVSTDAVLTEMKHAAVGTGIVILDANRDNPFGRNISRRMADLPSGFFVAYSTAPGEFSRQGDGAHSPYATALAVEMVKPGQLIEEVFRNVRIRVMQATSDRQLPWETSSLQNAFYFVGADD